MEKKLCIKNYTNASVSCVTYLPLRREVVAGFEGKKKMLFACFLIKITLNNQNLGEQFNVLL